MDKNYVMQKSPLNYKTAFFLTLVFVLIMGILFLMMFFFGRETMAPNEHTPRVTFKITNILLHVFLLTFLLYIFNFRLLKKEYSSPKKWLFIIFGTFTLTAILSLSFSCLQSLMDSDFRHRFFIGNLFRDCSLSVIVMLSAQLIYLSNKQQQTALENKTLLAENMRTRYAVLKNQVDPHFLFNSLNTLNALIKMDADKAQEYVQQLSYVFRYTLQNKEVITLNEELKFALAYCNLMQIRYGECLQIVPQVDEKYADYLIVPLSLQVLVENAIKHNVVSNKQPLKIIIATTDNATVKISNPVQLKKEADPSEGIGLKNLSERYRLMWQKDIRIKNDGEMFEVEAPLIGNHGRLE